MDRVILTRAEILDMIEALENYLLLKGVVYGICCTLDEVCPVGSKWALQEALDWSEHSGKFTEKEPHIEYFRAKDQLADNEYGRSRRRLVKFLITRLGEEYYRVAT